MPNWCENELTITGPEKEIAAFVEYNGEDLDFNKYVPYPEHFTEMDRIAEQYMKDHPDDWMNRPKDGYNSGGYEWCIQNWGTKCNANQGSTTINPRSVFFSFDTAWSPPIPVVKAMSKQFPKLKFKIKYWEGGAAYRGSAILKADDIISKSVFQYRGQRGG